MKCSMCQCFQFSFDAILITGLTSTLSLPFNGTRSIEIRKDEKNPIFCKENEEEGRKTKIYKIENPFEKDRYYLLSAFSCVGFVNGILCVFVRWVVNELVEVGGVAHKCRLFQHSISISISRTNHHRIQRTENVQIYLLEIFARRDVCLDICIYSRSHEIADLLFSARINIVM